MSPTLEDQAASNCPQWRKHSQRAPAGYIEWHEWAQRMERRGYVNERCPGCGLWKVWERKKGGYDPSQDRADAIRG